MDDLEAGRPKEEQEQGITANDGANVAVGASTIHIEHGFAKNILSVLWWTSFICAAAVTGLVFNYLALNRLSAHHAITQSNISRLETRLELEGILPIEEQH